MRTNTLELLASFNTICSILTTIATVEPSKLECYEGDDVYFDCPCCPEEADSCRFKKLFQGGFISRDGAIDPTGHRLFEINTTGIALRGCTAEHEGAYVWMCGRCNVNIQFDLHVRPFAGGTTRLRCQEGSDVSFKRPCSMDEINLCRFKKLFRNGLILDMQMQRGILNKDKFYLDNGNTQITLRRCEIEDEGSYAWMCGNCDMDTLFELEVYTKIGEPIKLKCYEGNDIYFECSCCPEEPNSCIFAKLGQVEYISINGLINRLFQDRYEIGRNKTGITLKGCTMEHDGGYLWMCGKFKDRQIDLEIQPQSSILEETWNAPTHNNELTPERSPGNLNF